MAFIHAFSEPQSHLTRVPPPPALGQSLGEGRAARVAPQGTPSSPSPAARGEDWAPSPFQTFFYMSTTPRPRGRRSGSPGSKPPRTMWKPQPHGSIADWLEHISPSPAAPEEDWAPSPVQTSFHISTTPRPRGRKSSSPGSIPPRTVWKPQSHGPIVDWLGQPPQSRRTRGGLDPISVSDILPYL